MAAQDARGLWVDRIGHRRNRSANFLISGKQAIGKPWTPWFPSSTTNSTSWRTALVNEAYVRLAKQGPFQTQNREHLAAVSAIERRGRTASFLRPANKVIAPVRRVWKTW